MEPSACSDVQHDPVKCDLHVHELDVKHVLQICLFYTHPHTHTSTYTCQCFAVRMCFKMSETPSHLKLTILLHSLFLTLSFLCSSGGVATWLSLWEAVQGRFASKQLSSSTAECGAASQPFRRGLAAFLSNPLISSNTHRTPPQLNNSLKGEHFGRSTNCLCFTIVFWFIPFNRQDFPSTQNHWSFAVLCVPGLLTSVSHTNQYAWICL